MSDTYANPEIELYLKTIVDPTASVVRQSVLAKPGKGETKAFGYGTPLLIEYELEGTRHKAVLNTIRPSSFGHEHMSDRAQSLPWDHSAFNSLPRHVRSIDVGAFRSDHSAISLRNAEEFFTLTAYGEGTPYAQDLERLCESGAVHDVDQRRAETLCDYLTEIHATRSAESGLYVRRIRELVGHSECIMGLIDSYPVDGAVASSNRLAAIEHSCVDWRWRLKNRVHRLRQVHGDFHPWNILFGKVADFCVLDRSRGEWGDPADDVTCLTMNYLFFSLQRSGRLEGEFEVFFRDFWTRYLEKTNDMEMLEVAAPFFAFRGLVMAHPLWYPHLSDDVREKLWRFIEVVLGETTFNPAEVNNYCGA